MRLFIGCDHRGAAIQNELILSLNNIGYNDIYVSLIEHSEEDDYVDFALDICNKMDKKEDIGVLICGNGVGMSIIANKVKGIRCARVVNNEEAIAARQHNGSNALALGANLGVDSLVSIIDTFIKTPTPSEERHQRRVNKIIDYEKSTYNEL